MNDKNSCPEVQEKIGLHEGRLDAHTTMLTEVKTDIKEIVKKVDNIKWYLVGLAVVSVASGFSIGGETTLNRLISFIIQP